MVWRTTANGRRWSTSRPVRPYELGPTSTPEDPNVHLPLSLRDVTEETLPDGTVLLSYNDQPDRPAPLQLPEPDEPLEPLGGRRDRPPKPPSNDRWDRWGAGPLPRRGA